MPIIKGDISKHFDLKCPLTSLNGTLKADDVHVMYKDICVFIFQVVHFSVHIQLVLHLGV